MGEAKHLHAAELLALLRRDQRERWECGERVMVEEYLDRYPTLRGDSEQVLDLIYSEFCLRAEADEEPQPEEYLVRFSELSEQLASLFEIHNAIDTSQLAGLVETEDDANATSSALRPIPPGHLLPSMRAKAASAARTDIVLPPRYEFIAAIGQGGMGKVVRARDTRLDRVVAIKVLRHGSSSERFLREARLLANLNSSDIVSVYDVDFLADGRPLISMEWVDGTDLQSLIGSRSDNLSDQLAKSTSHWRALFPDRPPAAGCRVLVRMWSRSMFSTVT